MARSLLAVAGAGAFFACGDEGGGTAPPSTGAVTGQVTDLEGVGVRGVTVHLRRIGASSDAKPVETTGLEGRYIFTGVVSNDYAVSIEFADTLTADTRPTQQTVTVEAEMVSVVPTFQLRVLAGTVDGFVQDDGGDPLGGRTVVLQRQQSTESRSTLTKPDGRYSFSSVTIGEYTVRAVTQCGESHTPPGTFAVFDGDTSVANLQISPGACSLSREVQPLLTRSCARSGCHDASVRAAAGLDLSPGQTHANTVNVPSSQVGFDLVEPFSPQSDTSYVVCKLESDCPQLLQDRMPLGASPLTQAQVDTIRKWIAEGALDN